MTSKELPRWTYEIPKNAVKLCNDCKHRSKQWPNEIKCDAFPDGIPDEVLFCDLDHRKPIDGDRGIQFEPNEVAVK